MNMSSRFSPELPERAARMVQEHRRDGLASDERKHVKTLDGEVKELRRVN